MMTLKSSWGESDVELIDWYIQEPDAIGFDIQQLRGGRTSTYPKRFQHNEIKVAAKKVGAILSRERCLVCQTSAMPKADYRETGVLFPGGMTSTYFLVDYSLLLQTVQNDQVEFNRLTDEWQKGTMYLSSPQAIARHPGV